MPTGEELARGHAGSSLRLARVGSFHVGGRNIRITGQPTRDVAFTASAAVRYDPNGLFHIEQAYVQYFVPEDIRFGLPLVLLHGGGFSGTMWERTPDDREGWLQAFLRRGFVVNVVDNVERGRAGWCPFPEAWPEAPILRSAQEAWTLFRFGSPFSESDLPAQGLPFEGLRFPIARVAELLMQGVPRWPGNNDIAVAGLRAVLERVGPCVLLAHSHGAEIAFRAASAAPDMVRAVIAIEPSGFATGLTEGSVAGRSHLFIYGDYISTSPLWVGLVDRAKAFCQDVESTGGDVTWWSLPDLDIRGNSHMLMMDDNSDLIAHRIADWLLANPRLTIPKA